MNPRFSRNQIDLDPKTLALNAELKSTIQSVAPPTGAVMKVKFGTDTPPRAVALRVGVSDG